MKTAASAVQAPRGTLHPDGGAESRARTMISITSGATIISALART